MRGYRLVAFVLLFLSALAAGAAPSAARLKLGQELARLVGARARFAAYLKECAKGQDSTFNADLAYAMHPAAFGGLSPTSSYWPKVEDIYDRLRKRACSFMTADQFAEFTARQFAARNTVRDLHAAIAFYSSPSGRHFVFANQQIDAAFQMMEKKRLVATYKATSEQLTVELKALIKRAKKHPD